MAVPPTQVAMIEAPNEFPSVHIAPRRGWLAVDLPELRAYRELLFSFVWLDFKVRYKQTVIGAAWAVLQPLMTMLVFSLFFGRLAKIPSQGLPHPIFYYCASLPWMYFSTAMQGATNIVVDQQRVIAKIYFPRVVLPIAAVFLGMMVRAYPIDSTSPKGWGRARCARSILDHCTSL
jgi:lipopolysaccharide transport system permease protein